MLRGFHHHKNFSNLLGAGRGSVSLGAWFGFAFLAAVLCELCGKEELNREERQGIAKDAKQVLRPRGKLHHYLGAEAHQ